jgi:hypothetical protein
MLNFNFSGKYCCTNGANNPNCELPTTRTTARTTTKFRGPTYLPPSRIITTRGPTTTDNYTYGSLATFTYRYNWTHGPWSGEPRTRNYTIGETSTTPKYSYEGQNSITYNGESDNAI